MFNMDIIFMITALPILSIILWLPIVAGSMMLLTAHLKCWSGALKYTSIAISVITLLLISMAIFSFELSSAKMQFAEHVEWLPSLGIEYALGVDGFAILLIALTSFMTLLVLIAAFTNISRDDYIKYTANFLIMQGLMCGVFMASDAVLFYIFFEAMMIPMFLVIGIWGGKNRVYATIKFILYTFFGSLFLLVAILYLNHVAAKIGYTGVDCFSITTFQHLSLSLAQQQWLFWAFLLAFAIKIPMWPVHTWLPDAHVEAPTGGSVILAAITLKIGGYGMLRFLLPIATEGCAYFATLVIALSLITIVYIGLITIIQQDLKKLIAYSSIAHMAFVTLGFFVIFKIGINTAVISIDGAVLQMLSHGFISGALFLCVGVLYSRMHTRKISDYGGVVNSMPVFATFFMLFALANVGMPGTVGFVGEFFVILASFQANVIYGLIAATSLILGVAYTLWMYKRVIFGDIVNNSVAALKDLAINEKIIFLLVGGVIILFGIWPNPLLDVLRSSSQHLATQLVKNK